MNNKISAFSIFIAFLMSIIFWIAIDLIVFGLAMAIGNTYVPMMRIHESIIYVSPYVPLLSGIGMLFLVFVGWISWMRN